MNWNVYLSGEIHSDWRQQLVDGARELDLPVIFTSAVTDHQASDAAGDLLGAESSGFWRDHKSSKVNAIRTKTLIEKCDIAGVKWRNWKMLIKEIDEESYAIQNMAYPSIYNLIIDPKEEEPENFYLDDTWVDAPLWQVIEDHEASIEEDPGAPDS